MNFRRIDRRTIRVALDDTTRLEDVRDILGAFAGARAVPSSTRPAAEGATPRRARPRPPQAMARASWLTRSCPCALNSRKLLSKFGWVMPLKRNVQR